MSLRVYKGHPCRQHLTADMGSPVQTSENATPVQHCALNGDCLHYLWWVLPNQDLVRCEGVCKTWQQSIEIWSKFGLQSRFGGYRLNELLGHVDQPDGNRHDFEGSDMSFQIFKDLCL
jgi:hypothetical protein